MPVGALPAATDAGAVYGNRTKRRRRPDADIAGCVDNKLTARIAAISIDRKTGLARGGHEV